MKRLISLILIATCTSASADNFSTGHLRRLEQISNPTLSDLEHEFPGCPANSFCTKETGELMQKWQKKVKSVEGSSATTIHKQVQSFMQENGVPIMGLVAKENVPQIQKQSILWNTRCRQHRNKQEVLVFKAISFLKKIVPDQSHIYPKVQVKTPKGIKSFYLPFDETPIMMKDDQLIVGQDQEDIFYHLWIDDKGNISVRHVDHELLGKATLQIERAKCQKKAKPDSIFAVNICKKIWDATSGQMIDVEIEWSCP